MNRPNLPRTIVQLVLCALLATVTTYAGDTDATAGKERRGDRPNRPERVNPDTNGDCIVDDTEAVAAADRMIARFRTRNEFVLKRFDEDGDGTLSAAEITKLETAMSEHDRQAPKVIENIDADHNWVISDAEAETAKTNMIERFRTRNAKVLEKFDADKDGQLTGDEIDAAKKAMEEVRQRARERRGQEGQGGQGGRGGRGTRGGNADAAPAPAAEAVPIE